MAAPRVVILCPFLTHVEPACERGLREAEAAGFEVRRYAATAAVDRTRGDAAHAALQSGADAILWIDSDVAFTVAEVRALCAHRLPVVAGLYPKKGVRDFAVHLERGTTELGVGDAGGLYDVRYVGAGFLYTERVVFDDVRRHFGLPICNTRFGAPTVPYFLPMVIADPDGPPGSVLVSRRGLRLLRARAPGRASGPGRQHVAPRPRRQLRLRLGRRRHRGAPRDRRAVSTGR
jgi:hypothetical protein